MIKSPRKIIKAIIYIILFLFASDINGQGSRKQTIMAIFAHPDDAELTVGHLLSYYAAKGYPITLVIATKGEKGTTQHAKIPAGDSLATVRALEAACACKTLGILPPILLGLNDGELDVDFTGKPLHDRIDSVLRLYKPDVVITWGPEGGYGHLDHRMVHNVVTEIFQSGSLAKPTQLYYTGFPSDHFKPAPAFKTSLGTFFHERWMYVKKDHLTTRIPVGKIHSENAIKAVSCNRSQFTNEHFGDLRLMLSALNKDTAYLRPFLPGKMKYDLFK